MRKIKADLRVQWSKQTGQIGEQIAQDTGKYGNQQLFLSFA
jgi:hypothetical protein